MAKRPPYKPQTSIRLDKVNEYVYDNTFFGLNQMNYTHTQAYSFSVWLNFGNTAGTQTVLGKTDFVIFAGRKGYWLNTNGASMLFVIQENVTNYIGMLASGAITSGVWQHWCVTYDGSNTTAGIKIYRNGVDVSSLGVSSGTVTVATNTKSFILGAKESAVSTIGEFLGGGMDEFSSWTTELTATDVVRLYNSGKPTDLLHDNKMQYLDKWYTFAGPDGSFLGGPFERNKSWYKPTNFLLSANVEVTDYKMAVP